MNLIVNVTVKRFFKPFEKINISLMQRNIIDLTVMLLGKSIFHSLTIITKQFQVIVWFESLYDQVAR